MALNLKTELAIYGCHVTPDEFTDLLVDVFVSLCPSWNVEELLYHPKEALAFAGAVQSRTTKKLPDHVILRRLNNIHKTAGGTTAVHQRNQEKLTPKPRKKK